MARPLSSNDLSTVVRSQNDKRFAIIVLKMGNRHSNTEIAKTLGCSLALVTKICKQFELSGTFTQMPRSGRPKTSVYSHLAQTVEKNIDKIRNWTRDEVLAWIKSISRFKKVTKTMLNRILKKKNYKAYLCRRVPFLTEQHKKDRVKWAKYHLVNNTDFDKWIFTDECCATLYGNWRRRYLCKQDEIRQDRHYIARQEPFERRSVCIKFWAAASAKGKCCLFIMEGKKNNSDCYIQIIKRAKSHFSRHMKNYVFQHDNASTHVSDDTRKALRALNMKPVFWPAKSPDLSPIENVLSLIKKRMRHFKVKNKLDLKRALILAWRSLSNNKIRSCFQRYRLRLKRVIKLKGNII